LGWFGNAFYVSGGYGIVDGRYGIPFANEFHGHEHEEVHGHQDEHADEEDEGQHGHEEELEAIDVDWRSHSFRLDTGVQGLDSIVENIRVGLSYTEWRHDELEILPDGDELTGTEFDNKQFTYRGEIDHSSGRLLGTIGVWGTTRDYQATGVEALSPPVDQNGIAFFALEELNYERLKFQFGARVEHIRYMPKGPFERAHDHEEEEEPHEHEDAEESELVFLPDRNFTGLSGSAGLRIGLWNEGAFVAHFTSAYRAPALEELYNFGPHVGNLAFEIGNPNLNGERSNGFDLSLRHAADRVRAEGNFFYYDLKNFIFGAPTGEIEDGLFELEYEQADSRFLGGEFGLDFALNDYMWLTTGLDLVDAKLKESGTPLPRIPPLRGRLGIDFRYDLLSVRPEVVLGARQDSIFPTETETAGYGVVNLKAAYTLPKQHFVHHFAFEVFNVGNKLYRNHVSFIKDLAPEMGRGVRLSYAVKFF
jgi:iron complex outermembrane receptor protein